MSFKRLILIGTNRVQLVSNVGEVTDYVTQQRLMETKRLWSQ